MTKEIVFKMDAGYGREGVIERSEGVCDKCGLSKEVLAFDSSEGEYGAFTLCASCVAGMYSSAVEPTGVYKCKHGTVHSCSACHWEASYPENREASR